MNSWFNIRKPIKIRHILIKDINNTIISIVTEKSPLKNQHLYIIKTLNKLGIELPQPANSLYVEPIAYIILNVKKWKHSL